MSLRLKVKAELRKGDSIHFDHSSCVASGILFVFKNVISLKAKLVTWAVGVGKVMQDTHMQLSVCQKFLVDSLHLVLLGFVQCGQRV